MYQKNLSAEMKGEVSMLIFRGKNHLNNQLIENLFENNLYNYQNKK